MRTVTLDIDSRNPTIEPPMWSTLPPPFTEYDVTTEDFTVAEVWEGNKQTVEKFEFFNSKDFANQEKLNERLKKSLLG